GQPTLNSASPTEAQEAMYKLPQQDFYDVVSGGNNGYDAGSGYDLVTGLGTPVADLLIPDLITFHSGAADRSLRTVTITAANSPPVGSGEHGPTNVFSTMNAFRVFNAAFVWIPSEQGNVPTETPPSLPGTPVSTAAAPDGATANLRPVDPVVVERVPSVRQ